MNRRSRASTIARVGAQIDPYARSQPDRGLDQNLDRQLDGIQLDKTLADSVSGKDTQRPQLESLLGFVRESDTVIGHWMDRLARNLDDLRAIVRVLTARGVRVEFVKEQLTFGRGLTDGQPPALGDGRLRRVLTRTDPRTSTRGNRASQQRGAYRGRKKALANDQIDQLTRRADAGESKSALVREFNVSRETVYQYLRAAAAAT